MLSSVELFSGAGGLAYGMALAGFKHKAVIERDTDSCDTLRLNKRRKIKHVRDWRILEADCTAFDYSEIEGPVDVLAGGVPCQPFSLGGKHRAHLDERDMFPHFARAISELRPKAFIVENVKGLLRSSFSDYFEYVVLRLSHPAVPKRREWPAHCRELEKIHTSGENTGLDYNVVFHLLNAADYGVPQRRERVFIVGFRSDLGIRWSFPEPTHSHDALLHDKWVTGDYWERHRVSKRSRPKMADRYNMRVAMLRAGLLSDGTDPWATVRDAISDLPKLKIGATSPDDPNHFLNPGARSYKGHTGSPLDEPAKTLKAGDHGVPGGENTLDLGNGDVRYFSVREAARIQSFPDGYWFSGAWTERMRQVGNAVPVELASVVARSVFEELRTQ